MNDPESAPRDNEINLINNSALYFIISPLLDATEDIEGDDIHPMVKAVHTAYTIETVTLN